MSLLSDLGKCETRKADHFLVPQNKKDAGVLKPGADVAVLKDIAGEAERLEIKDNKAVMVLVELLFDENIVAEVSFEL